MTNEEAIELLKNAVPQYESLDEEGLFIEAVNMAIKALEKAETNCPEIPDSCNAETVEAIPVDWIGEYLAWLKGIGGYGLSDARAIQSMIIKWKTEHTNGCGPDYCDINFGGGTKA